MMNHQEIVDLVRSAVSTTLRQPGIDEIRVVPAFDQEGAEALQITIVLTPQAANAIDGEQALRTLVAIGDRLRGAGEQRYPLVEYSSPSDEADLGADP